MAEDIKKITNLIESTLSVTALFAIIVMAVGLVVLMNPQRALGVDGSVAGIDTNGGMILGHENYYDYPGHHLSIEESDSSITYSIIPKDLKEGTLNIDLLSFTNQMNRDVKFTLTSEVTGYVGQNLNISLKDTDGREFYIYPAENELVLSVDSYSQNNYSLNYYVEKNINFPTEIRLTFSF